MRTRFVVILVALLTTPAAFAGSGVTTSRYTPTAAPAKGVLYALPRTLLKVELVYTLTETTTITEGSVDGFQQKVLVEKPVKVTPLTAPDEGQRFVLSGDNTSRNPFLSSTFEFKLDDHGSLLSAGGTIDDKSLDALQSLVSAGVQVAKIAVAAGTKAIDANHPLAPVVARIRELYGEIAVMAASKNAKKLDRLKDLRAELDALRSLVQNYNEANKEVVTTRDVAYTVTLDPAAFTWNTASNAYEYEIRPDNLIDGIAAAMMPQVTVQLFAKPADFAKAATSVAIAKQSGIVYRSSIPVGLAVTVNKPANVVLHDVVSIAQFGDLGVAPVERKLFTSRNTTLLMSGESGGLKEYKVVSGSSADAAASKLASSLDTVRGSLLDIQYGIELEELKKKKELLDAQNALKPAADSSAADQRLAELKKEQELLAAELAVVKAKQDLENAKKPAP